jgi:hypothetical protein
VFRRTTHSRINATQFVLMRIGLMLSAAAAGWPQAGTPSIRRLLDPALPNPFLAHAKRLKLNLNLFCAL